VVEIVHGLSVMQEWRIFLPNSREDIRQAFFDDAQNHLAAMGVLLLELEVAGKDADHELLDGLLRAAHALKCSAGFLDYRRAFTLARALESFLDMWREGTLVPDESTAARVEKAFDILAVLLTPSGTSESEQAARSEKSAEAEALAAVLDAAGGVEENGGGTQCPAQYRVYAPDGALVFEGHCPDLHLAGKTGSNLYVLEFIYEEDLNRKDLSPQALLGFLQKSGYILAIGGRTVPVGYEPADVLCVLYASFLEKDLIAAVFQIAAEKVHPVDLQDLLAGEAMWQAAVVKDAEDALLHAVREPHKDSVDELVRQYDNAMEKLRAASDEDKEPLEGWDIEAVVSLGNGGEVADPFCMAVELHAADPAGAENTAYDATAASDCAVAQGQTADADEAGLVAEFEDSFMEDEAELLLNELPEEHPLRAAYEAEPQGDEEFFRDTEEQPDLSYLNEALPDETPAGGVVFDLAMPVAESDTGLQSASLQDAKHKGEAEMIAGFAVGPAQDGNAGVLQLAGDITIERSAQLQEAFQEALSRYEVLRIDSQQLESADLTLVQLLCAAAAQAKERGGRLESEGLPSAGLMQTLVLAGFDDAAMKRRGLETFTGSGD
jgi:chemotaxis protein histidine kinase CheA